MHCSPLIHSLVAAAVLIAPALASPVAAAAPAAASRIPGPASQEFVTIYGEIVNGTTADAIDAIEKSDVSIQRRSYTGSCDNCSVQGTKLQCNCRDPYGGIFRSTLDLNKCLANANGDLQWRFNGGYGGSCLIDPTGELRGSMYNVRCPNNAGEQTWTQKNLDENIHNQNSLLHCTVPR